jgi:1-phosphofructokinase family hexose kinase
MTLNPAIDKVLFVDEFVPGRTARISRTLESIGGKGTHVSINLKALGQESIALGVTLGENGRKLARLMADHGVETQFLHDDARGMESRTNFVLVEEKQRRCTMLADRGPVLPERMTEALIKQLRALLKGGDILALTGDARNVEDTAIYSRLSFEAGAAGAAVALDTSGPYLAEGLKSKPFLIKPNFEELCYLSGRELDGEAEIVAALKELRGAGIAMIAMTWGPRGAFFAREERIFRVDPISVDIVNEAGCGDAYLAAILSGYTQGMQTEDMLAMAAAVSAATAESELTVGFDRQRMDELQKQASVRRLS